MMVAAVMVATRALRFSKYFVFFGESPVGHKIALEMPQHEIVLSLHGLTSHMFDLWLVSRLPLVAVNCACLVQSAGTAVPNLTLWLHEYS